MLREVDHHDLDSCCLCGRAMSANSQLWPFCSVRCSVESLLGDEYADWCTEMDRYYDEMQILGRS